MKESYTERNGRIVRLELSPVHYGGTVIDEVEMARDEVNKITGDYYHKIIGKNNILLLLFLLLLFSMVLTVGVRSGKHKEKERDED